MRSGNSNIESFSEFISQYDISDCKIKNELSAAQFRKSIVNAIEEFDDLSEIPTEMIEIEKQENSPASYIKSIEENLLDLENTTPNSNQLSLIKEASKSLHFLKGFFDK